MTSTVARPMPTEYAPFYAHYIDLVTGDDAVAALESELAAALALFGGIGEERSLHRYAPEKWSIRELVGHVVDSERIFGYRALRIARGDDTPRAGFDENAFAATAGHDAAPLADLLAELEHLRRSHVLFFKQLAPDAWSRRGTANDAAVTVRALAFIMAGHEKHHRSIVETRYL